MRSFRPMIALFLILAMLLGVGPPWFTGVAYADQRPVGCTENGAHLVIGKLEPPEVHFGSTITFRVKASNVGAGNCAAFNLTIDLTTPDGVTHPLKSGVSLAPGEETDWFTTDYAIRAEDVKNNEVSATATMNGSVHVNSDGVVDTMATINTSIPPKITVGSICTIGPTATQPSLIEVKGTTVDAVAPTITTTVTTTIGTASHSTTPLPDGSFTDKFLWTQISGAYDVTSTVSYLDKDKYPTNKATATVPGVAIRTITIAGGETVSTHLRRPTIAGTTDAAAGTSVLVTVDGVSEPTTVLAGGTWSLVWPHDLVFGTTYEVAARLDGGTACASDTQQLTVANAAPVAVNDAYATAEDTLLSVTAPGVMANDTDADGDPLIVVQYTSPAHGTLVMNTDGSFTYMPEANWNGSDSFTYQVDDGVTKSPWATVTIAVEPVNDPPNAVDDEYSTPEDTPLPIAAPGVLSNDTDIDSITLTSALVTGPTHGTLALNPDGSFDYTPDADWNGKDTFTYMADDGIDLSNVATVTITVTPVNDPPVAANDAYTTPEDTPLPIAAPGVLSNDTDAESSPLTATLVTGPAHGTLTLNSDGSFTYTPSANWFGTDTFTYKANDGAADSNVATVTITVTPVNDPPVAVDDAYSTTADTPLTSAAPGVLTNDTDVEGSALTAAKVTDPAKGTLTLNGDGSFTYTPAAGFSGQDSFTYKANDGAADSNVATVTITVIPPNHPPEANPDEYSTYEGTAVTIAAPGVLTNDKDVDGDPLTATQVSAPSHGTLTLNSNGSFTYTPTAGFTGQDSFTYQANDGKANSNVATVTINVVPIPPPNPPPYANDDAYTTKEGTPLTVPAPGVLSNDGDPDGELLHAVMVTGPAKGTVTLTSDGSFVYTPNALATGTDSFTYRAYDGGGSSNVATVTISLIPVNHPPVANPDNYRTPEETLLTIKAPGLLANDTDPDGDSLKAILVTGPAKGTLTLNSDGSFTYTPNYGATGTDSFTYKANDGSLDSNVATVTIIIDPNPVLPPTIEGTVINALTGLPVVGASVKVSADFDGDGTADLVKEGVTGNDGRYQFDVARRDWTYTAQVTAVLANGTGTVTVTTTHRTEVKSWQSRLFRAENKIAGRLLTTGWQIGGLLLDASGSVVSNPVTVGPDGLFEVGALASGLYTTVFQVISADGSKLAGAILPVQIGHPGELLVGFNGIAPTGLVTDAVSLGPVDGAKVTLYWADTKLNRDLGRLPDTPVTLPALPNLTPGLNAMPQETTVDGHYAWLVFPEGDYYIRAESNRYLPYDSRAEGRDVAALPGEDNYVQDGVIHVGHSALHYDFIMEPIHRRFIIGYPDGTFKPERSITRAEVAAILARNTVPSAVVLPLQFHPDVPATHWAATYIELVLEKGYMEVDASGNFRPDEPITRAELASAISRFEGLMRSNQTAFPDIKGNWAEQEINAAAEAGLVLGYPDGQFKPEEYTRRDEAATMFNRMLGRGPLSGRPQATWPDVPLTNWASGQVEEASNSHSAVRAETGGERWTGDTGETTW